MAAEPFKCLDRRTGCNADAVICLHVRVSVSAMPHHPKTAQYRLLTFARSRPIVRPRDLAELRIHTGELTRLARAGQLERVGPGRYRLAGKRSASEQHDLVVAASAVPGAVVCLLSALRFHGIGTQLPPDVWIAVPRGTRVPRLATPPMRVVSVNRSWFDIGVEQHRIEGRPVRVFSVTRTVADCFRFRNTIGLDVALEALSDAWRGHRLDLDELNRIAKQLRVQRVMQPYLETVVL
jgi:predicted transcriptional regulator of viral defense system